MEISPLLIETIEKLNSLGLQIPTNIDNRLFKIIEFNKVTIKDSYLKETIRNWLWSYGDFVKNLQNYYFSINDPLHKLIGKLFTRIWWLYNDSADFS